MEFLVRLYFVGLIAFVPSPDGRELNVLVLDATHGYSASDGTRMTRHMPLLLARAGNCRGPCLDRAQQVADWIYQGVRRPNPAESLKRLEEAIGGGGVWHLADSYITIEAVGLGSRSGPQLAIHRSARLDRNGKSLPASRTEAEDFDWVADVTKIVPSAGAVHPDTLAARPKQKLISARFKFTDGVVKSQRLVSIDNEIVALSFYPLGETPLADAAYAQALTESVVVELSVRGEGVRIIDTNFIDGSSRSFELAPEEGRNIVEVAVVNLPAGSFFAKPKKLTDDERNVGKHFERYYELSQHRPRTRPVPHLLKGGSVPLKSLYSGSSDDSELLEAIGLRSRGIQGRPICPVAQFSGGAGR